MPSVPLGFDIHHIPTAIKRVVNCAFANLDSSVLTNILHSIYKVQNILFFNCHLGTSGSIMNAFKAGCLEYSFLAVTV